MKARLPPTPRDGTQSSLVGSLSPPYSNPSHSPDPASYDSASYDSGSPASLVESLPSLSPGMVDKSRLALCMVIFTVVLFNPLAPLVSDSEGMYVTEGSSGRTILERKEEINMTTFLRVSTSSLMLSMLNVLFILAGNDQCRVKLTLRLPPRFSDRFGPDICVRRAQTGEGVRLVQILEIQKAGGERYRDRASQPGRGEPEGGPGVAGPASSPHLPGLSLLSVLAAPLPGPGQAEAPEAGEVNDAGGQKV